MAAGPLLNVLGPRWTTVFAMTGYPIYIGKDPSPSSSRGATGRSTTKILAAGFWYYDVSGHTWFPIFGGAFLGITAGLLWTVASM